MADGKRKKHPPWLFVDLAVTHDLIDVHQAEAVVDGLKVETGSRDPLPYAQAMILQGLIHGPDLVPMCAEAGLPLLRCGDCGARFDEDELGPGRCPRCGVDLESNVDLASRLSDIAVLSCEGIDDLPVTVWTGADAKTFHDASPRLARFRVEGELGRGGSAVVLKAIDPDLDRTCAIKVVRPGAGGSLSAIGRFQREAKLSARLHHPGIVAVYEVGRCPDFLFLVQEFVEGDSLADELGRRRPLSIRRSVHVISAALQGLGYAHECGVIHRDIKPQNIMVTPTGKVKLIDFGLGLDAGGEATPEEGAITRAGQAVGTPHFMSPEQVRSSHDVDTRTDIYSMGAVLYLCLTGVTPFRGKAVIDVVSQIVNEDAPPPSQRNREIPPALDAVILEALARDPDRRFATAEDFRRALLAVPLPEEADDSARVPRIDGALPGATPAGATPGPFQPVTLKTPTGDSLSGPAVGTPDFLAAVTLKVPTEDHGAVVARPPDFETEEASVDPGVETEAASDVEPDDERAPPPSSGALPAFPEPVAAPERGDRLPPVETDSESDGADVFRRREPPGRARASGIAAASRPVDATPSRGSPIPTARPAEGSSSRLEPPTGATKRPGTKRRASARMRRPTTGSRRRAAVGPPATERGSSGRHQPTTRRAVRVSGRAPVSARHLRSAAPGKRSGAGLPPASDEPEPPRAARASERLLAAAGSGDRPRGPAPTRSAVRARRSASWSLVVTFILATGAAIAVLVVLQKRPDLLGGKPVASGASGEGKAGPAGPVETDPGEATATPGPAPTGAEGAPADPGATTTTTTEGPAPTVSAEPAVTAEPAGDPELARAKLEAARGALERGFAERAAGADDAGRPAFEEALGLVREAAAAGGGAAAALVEADVLEEGLGDRAGARALFERLQESPDAPIAALARARLALARGAGGAALVDARAVARKLPEEPLVIATLGEAMVMRGRLEEAKTVLRRAVARHPARVLPRLAMARAVLAEGDTRRAVSLLAGLPPGAPGQATALAMRAVAELSLGDRNRAARSVRAALVADADSADAHLSEAFLGIAQGVPLKARQSLDAALALRPEDLVALRTRAWVRAGADDLEGAVADIDRALAAGPGDGLSLAIRAVLMVRREAPEEALALVRRAEEAGVDPIAIHAIRARARLAQNDPAEALIEANRILAARPDDATGLLLRGIALTLGGQVPEALDALERAAAGDRRTGRPQLALGNLALRRGLLADAREHYEEALQLTPGLAEARFGLGLAWLRQERTHEAVEQLEAFVAARPEHPAADAARRAAAAARVGVTRIAALTAREAAVFDSDGTTARFAGASSALSDERDRRGWVLELDLSVGSDDDRAPMIAVMVAVEKKVVRVLYAGKPGRPSARHHIITVEPGQLRKGAPTTVAIVATKGFGEDDVERMRRSIERDLDLGRMPGVPVMKISPEGTDLDPLDVPPDPIGALDPVSITVGS